MAEETRLIALQETGLWTKRERESMFVNIMECRESPVPYILQTTSGKQKLEVVVPPTL